MTSQIGTHFHTRNTRNPTLGAGCRFECEPRIDILKQYSLFKHFLYQNSRTTACSDTTIETIMRDSTSVFGVQLKNTNLTPILVRKKFKNLFLHCWNCIQICHLLVWPISSSMHNAFSEKKGQKWWKITIHDLGLQDTPSVFCQKKERAGGAIPQIKSAKMHRAVKISQLIDQF